MAKTYATDSLPTRQIKILEARLSIISNTHIRQSLIEIHILQYSAYARSANWVRNITMIISRIS